MLKKSLTGTGLAALMVCSASWSQTSRSSALAVDIESQSLDQAINVWAAQTGYQVLLSAVPSSDSNVSPLVKGQYTPEGALDVLLASTDLKYQFVNSRTVAIRRADATGAEAAGERGAAPEARLARAEANDTAAVTSGPDANKKLVEVVVTASRREERLIDTPQSVSLLTAKDLTNIGATQFRDFANTVPGLTFTTLGTGATQINLRGVTTGNDVSSTVAIYIDDVPYGSSNAFNSGSQQALDLGLFDLNSLEVLRGPQGTLYGSASMGGLLKYVMKRSSADEFAGDVQTGVSSTVHGGINYNVAGAVNMPLVTDKLAVRASGFQSHDGGYIDNVTLNQKDVNEADVYGGRLDMLYAPTSDLSFRLMGFLQDIKRDGQATADYQSNGSSPGGDLNERRPYAEPFNQRYRLVSGTLSYNFAAATLTSISGYQTSRTDLRTDNPALLNLLRGAPFNRPLSAIGTVQYTDFDKFTQEVRLSSSGTRTLEWIAGLVYTRETATKSQIGELYGLQGQPLPNDIVTLVIPSKYQDYAAYGDITYHFTDKFDATVGVRYARNEQTVEQIGSGLAAASRPKRDADENVTTYLANARYHFADNATGYARFATGYRPGGPNIVLNNLVTGLPQAPPTFESDKLKSYELGFKAETENRIVGIDAALYYIDWDNIQLFGPRGSPPVSVRTNAPGGAKIRGVELGATVNPTEAFTLTTALAYIDAHLAQAFPDLSGAKGEQLPGVPRFSGTLSGDYRFAVADLKPYVGFTVRNVSERHMGFRGAPSTYYQVPGYTSVDIRTGFRLSAVNLQLYAHNLFDRRGQFSESTIVTGTPIAQVSIQQPRTIGISATASF